MEVYTTNHNGYIYKPSLINLLQTLCFYLYVEEAHPNLPPRSVEAPQKCPLQAAKIQGALALIIAYRTAEGSKVGKSP